MNKSKLFIAICSIALLSFGCGNGAKTKESNDSKEIIATADSTVQIIYFHGDRRCPTCISIEKISTDVYNQHFKGEKSVKFFNMNIDRDENRSIAEKFRITGSSLVINVKGKPNDITFEAFKYALDEPDSLGKLIVDIVVKGING